MSIGYVIIPKDDQYTAAQAAALQVAGSERIFRETISDGRFECPQMIFLGSL